MKKLYILFLVLLIPFVVFAEGKVNPPQPISPVQNADMVQLNTVLDWEPVCGHAGIHYIVQLDTDENFISPQEMSSTLTSIETSLLKFACDYYWRIKALDTAGESDWSEIFHFTTIANVTPQIPINGQTNSDIEMVLEWKEIGGAEHYQIEVDTSETFSTGVLTSYLIPATESEFTISNLFFGVNYFWRVRASHENDTSQWSEPMTFATKSTLAALSPSNNAINQSPDIKLVCENVNGVSAYDFQISKDEQFINPYQYSTDTCVFLPPDNYFGYIYYWRARARNNGNNSEWSAARKYSVINTVFTTTPSNDATSVKQIPVFKWESISGIVNYQLVVDFNPEMLNFPITIDGNSSNYICDNTLYPDTEYFWKMRAISRNDTTEWSEIYSFTTCSAQGVVETDISPTVFPIPCDRILKIIDNPFNKKQFKIRIIDLSGKTIIKSNYENDINSLEIPTDMLKDGMYIIRLSNNEIIHSLKFVVKH